MTSTHETGTTNGRYEHGLRPEARTVWLDTLTADQERAFEALVGLVDAATKDLPDKDEWGNDPKFDRGLDPKQVSRVLLLGGGRGCGKTTVAQTLQEALDPDIAESIYSRKTWPEEKVTERRTRVRGRVERLGQQIIPLEMLRMNDTPTGTNVLAAVLARIEQLVFPHLTREDVRSTTGDRRQHDAVLDLLRLQTDVAIAWDGNLRERRGNLDPDNYAMEEMRAERVRLQLQDRFQTVLRRTARESLGHKEPAMFLLVVDDVDMDPGSLLQLLERLRMVAVPEMLVLLVGDIEPIEAAFRMHFAHRYRESTPNISPADIAMAPQEMAAMTNLIARSALRKYVPYHQRVMLQPRLRARDALEVRPLRQGLDVEDIRSMMTEVRVAYPPVPCRGDADKGTASTITLHDFVFPEKEAKTGGESDEQQTEADRTNTEKTEETEESEADHSKTERYWYVGSRLLADSPRVAVDMWYAVSDARATGSGAGPSRRPDHVDGYGQTRPERDAEQLDPRLHTFVRRLALERVDANSRLWPQETDDERLGGHSTAATRRGHDRLPTDGRARLHQPQEPDASTATARVAAGCRRPEVRGDGDPVVAAPRSHVQGSRQGGHPGRRRTPCPGHRPGIAGGSSGGRAGHGQPGRVGAGLGLRRTTVGTGLAARPNVNGNTRTGLGGRRRAVAAEQHVDDP